ncbi:MAG: hypothetical protein ACYC63_02055 [Armatimonadota bacterium]
MIRFFLLSTFLLCVCNAPVEAISPEDLASQQALLKSMEITQERLKPLNLQTALVAEGQARAIICHGDDPSLKQAAVSVQQAITAATGVTLPMRTDQQLPPEELSKQPVVLLGNLDNNRHVARLYHNFFVCCDQGFTGRNGYELRSVYSPLGGSNIIFIGSSFPQGMSRAAAAFGEIIKKQGSAGSLTVGRLLDLKFDEDQRHSPVGKVASEKEAENTIASYRKIFASPGEGRNGVNGLIRYGLLYHRTGDPLAGQVYKGLMAALLNYYRTDKVINADGMARYDNDFRDAWTFQVAILWDLLEESGLFSDQERLDYTNLVVRLGLECVLYQGYNRPETRAAWLQNKRIVHNHNTFPALGILFIGQYMQRHYQSPWAQDWIDVARGIFNGQKHTSKPLEDAAAYQWLPIIHCAIYSLSQEDMAFFAEGHMRRAALDAIQVMDNAGYQVAFGDHPSELSCSALPDVVQLAAWYYRDPQLLWAVQRACQKPGHPMNQSYTLLIEPREPLDELGIVVGPLPRPNYDYSAQNPQYPTAPNLPWEQTFNKLSLRAGWDRDDDYLLLDGFGRGTHMHFDANAILRYASGGLPLLVDGEYIKNSPKYHSSMLIMRDGQSEPTPAVTRLDRSAMLATAGSSQTSLVKYNGTDWARSMLWRPNDYLLVEDTVTALRSGDYTLRCCWRPWGEPELRNGSLIADNPPQRLSILNVTGQPARLELVKQAGNLPVSRFSEQAGVKLSAGQSHSFINVVSASPRDKWRQLKARQVRPGIVVVERPEGTEVAVLGKAAQSLPGLSSDGAVLTLSSDTLYAFDAASISDAAPLLKSTQPVSLELSPAKGAAVIVAPAAVDLTLRLHPNSAVSVGAQKATADAAGQVVLKLPAGQHQLKFAAFPMPTAITDCHKTLCAMPALGAGSESSGSAMDAGPPVWQSSAFDAPPAPLSVSDVSSAPEPTKGPVMKLVDGQYSSSAGSVMWQPGKTAVITLTLTQETEVRNVTLREWHMNEVWDVASRRLEVSSDGFKQDIRTVPGDFTEAGTQSWGSNTNTILELPVAQKATQLRLTVVPSRPDSSVYIAECQIMGLRPGQTPQVTAVAQGDLNADGHDEFIIAGDSGQIRALDAAGEVLWEYVAKERSRLNSLACADVNGDGRPEIMFGQTNAGLGLLSSEGKLLWMVNPPRFRSISSDVITVFPGDVNGDKRPEIICGCLSWQYFAYEATGKMIWRNVIYAHSATVGCAADIDGDGKDETIAGNTYYRLNAIDDDGTRLWGVGNIGPEMTAVAAADVVGDARPEVFTGVDDGTLYAYTGTGESLWKLNLGDKVTRIIGMDLTGDGKAELICSAESANVFAIKSDGTILWRTGLPDGCGDLAARMADGKPQIVVACGQAGVAVLDAQGKVRMQRRLPGRAERVLVAGSKCIVAQDNGVVAAVELR